MQVKFSRAELLAKKVLFDCGLNDPTELPIDVIIKGKKIHYNESPLKSKDGEIVSFGGRSIITINSLIEYDTKKRFAAAHELGHYEMHRDLSPIMFDTEYDLINWYKAGPQETEANEFASEFLMPTELFYQECKHRKFHPDQIKYLSDRFQVSRTAAILKFVKRGHHPVCIIYCKDNKMKWWKASQDFPYFLEFELNSIPPIGSVAYEVFTKKNTGYDIDPVQQIWKSDWFRMRYNERDTTFFEYCLYVKAYNYSISIVWEN